MIVSLPSSPSMRLTVLAWPDPSVTLSLPSPPLKMRGMSLRPEASSESSPSPPSKSTTFTPDQLLVIDWE